jgi:hypothetical protein
MHPDVEVHWHPHLGVVTPILEEQKLPMMVSCSHHHITAPT